MTIRNVYQNLLKEVEKLQLIWKMQNLLSVEAVSANTNQIHNFKPFWIFFILPPFWKIPSKIPQEIVVQILRADI